MEVEKQKRKMLDAIKKGVAEVADFAADMKEANSRIVETGVKLKTAKDELESSLSDSDVATMARLVAEFRRLR